jgi:branched-chain amino acid transport system substrate-binding protein
MTTQVRMLRQARAEAVLVVGIFEPAAAFVRDARLARWDVPVANVSFVGATNLIHKLNNITAKTGIDMTRNLINSQVVPSYNCSFLRLAMRLYIACGLHARTKRAGCP